MLPALSTAVTGLQEFQQQIDLIGNNIANVNTTGFKSSRADFEDTFSQALSSTVTVGSGVTMAATAKNFAQGTINTNTGVGTDLAVSGSGFFVVRDVGDNATFVTRAGDFHVDADGYLVTNEGYRVQGYSDAGLATLGDIKIDATGAPATATPGATVNSFSIDSSGKVNVTLTDQTTFVRGQVLLQNYSNPGSLLPQGQNLYSAPPAAGGLTQPAAAGTNGLGVVQAGALEMSNVDLSTQMADLITAQRAFEANAKIITTGDEVLQDLVNMKR